jgi:Recombinase zinc beta ribbon domain
MTRPGNRNLAVAGLMTCGHCGATVTAEVKKERYVCYHCGQRCTDDPYLREERVSNQLAEALRPLSLPEEDAAEVARVLRDSRKDIQAEQKQRLAVARARFEQLSVRIARAYEEKLDGKIDDAFFQRQRGAWELEQTQLHEEMERLGQVDGASLDTAVRVFELANRAFDVYNRSDLPGRRRLLDLVLSNCELRSGVLIPTYREPFDILAELGTAGNEPALGSSDPGASHPVWSGRQDSPSVARFALAPPGRVAPWPACRRPRSQCSRRGLPSNPVPGPASPAQDCVAAFGRSLLPAHHVEAPRRWRVGGLLVMVGETGFEPAACSSQSYCSTRLSYSPVRAK